MFAPHSLNDPAYPPIYDPTKTYLENIEHGPFFTAELPKRDFPPKESWKKCLDFEIASRIGVSSGPLFNSKWIKLASDLGFDILTYRTIHSHHSAAYPPPNIIYIETEQPMPKLPKTVKQSTIPSSIGQLSIAHSFGDPCNSSEILVKDMVKAGQSIKPGQLMIVSIIANPHPHFDLIQDFILAARLAKEAKVKVIEANLSCLNVAKGEGLIYMFPDIVFDLCNKLVKELRPIPLIIKTGLFSNKEQMHDVLVAATRAGVRGFSGINPLPVHVVDENGKSIFESHRQSFLSGALLRDTALSFIKDAKSINHKEKLDLTLFGCGGITLPEHFDAYFEHGADIALAATGMVWDPLLAARHHALHERSHPKI